MTDRPPRVRLWSLVLFRTLVTVEAGLALGQAVLAGGFLSGRYGALALHAANARATGVIAIAMTVAAVLLWKPGGGPGWPALACGVLIVAVGGQFAMGYARVLAVHVPLGVAITAAVVLMLRWAWRPLDQLTAGRRTPERAAVGRDATGRGAVDRLAADRPSTAGEAAARTASVPTAELPPSGLPPCDRPSAGLPPADIPAPRTATDTDVAGTRTPAPSGEVTL